MTVNIFEYSRLSISVACRNSLSYGQIHVQMGCHWFHQIFFTLIARLTWSLMLNIYLFYLNPPQKIQQAFKVVINFSASDTCISLNVESMHMTTGRTCWRKQNEMSYSPKNDKFLNLEGQIVNFYFSRPFLEFFFKKTWNLLCMEYLDNLQCEDHVHKFDQKSPNRTNCWIHQVENFFTLMKTSVTLYSQKLWVSDTAVQTRQEAQCACLAKGSSSNKIKILWFIDLIHSNEGHYSLLQQNSLYSVQSLLYEQHLYFLEYQFSVAHAQKIKVISNNVETWFGFSNEP